MKGILLIKLYSLIELNTFTVVISKGKCFTFSLLNLSSNIEHMKNLTLLLSDVQNNKQFAKGFKSNILHFNINNLTPSEGITPQKGFFLLIFKYKVQLFFIAWSIFTSPLLHN